MHWTENPIVAGFVVALIFTVIMSIFYGCRDRFSGSYVESYADLDRNINRKVNSRRANELRFI